MVMDGTKTRGMPRSTKDRSPVKRTSRVNDDLMDLIMLLALILKWASFCIDLTKLI